MNLPIAFEKKMRELLGAEFDDYIKCYEEKRLYGLRVNTKKISVEEFKKICPASVMCLCSVRSQVKLKSILRNILTRF